MINVNEVATQVLNSLNDKEKEEFLYSSVVSVIEKKIYEKTHKNKEVNINTLPTDILVRLKRAALLASVK